MTDRVYFPRLAAGMRILRDHQGSEAERWLLMESLMRLLNDLEDGSPPYNPDAYAELHEAEAELMRRHG